MISGLPGGQLARANAEIRDADGLHHQRTEQEWQVRFPILLIDRMLDDLERLNLCDVSRVPASYAGRLAAIKEVASSFHGTSRHLDQLKVRIKISTLLDALFDIQGVLLARQRGGFRSQARMGRTGRLERPGSWSATRQPEVKA